MGIGLGILLTMFVPHIVKEDVSKSILVKKSMMAVVMFLGLILVSF